MKRVLCVTLLCLPLSSVAANAIDGTWKTNLASIKFSGKPDVLEVKDGMYNCDTCVPAVHIKADGSAHAVTGHDYYDAVSARIVDPTSVDVAETRGGKPAASVSYQVSADGNTLTGKFIDYSGAKPVNGSYTEKRVAPAAAGAHAISGSWQTEAMSDLADLARTLSYQLSDDGLTMQWNGQRYDAKFDGKDYPVSGDPGQTMVSLKKINASTIEESDKRQGKLVEVIRSSVSADGKTLKVEDRDLEHGTTMRYTMDKQAS